MQRKRFWRVEIFFQNSSPPPLESQLDQPINAVFAPSLINRLTHPQHTPDTPPNNSNNNKISLNLSDRKTEQKGIVP